MRPRIIRTAAAIYGLSAAAAAGWIAWRAGLDGLSARLWGGNPGGSLAGGALLALAVVGAGAAAGTRVSWVRRLEDELALAVGPLDRRECAALALASAAGEEMLFRAALQPEVGLVPASLAFGLAHFPVRRTLWPWTLLAAGIGLALGVLFQWSGCLAGPFLAHALVNGINLHRLAARARRPA